MHFRRRNEVDVAISLTCGTKLRRYGSKNRRDFDINVKIASIDMFLIARFSQGLTEHPTTWNSSPGFNDVIRRSQLSESEVYFLLNLHIFLVYSVLFIDRRCLLRSSPNNEENDDQDTLG